MTQEPARQYPPPSPRQRVGPSPSPNRMMPPHSPPSPALHQAKRARESSPANDTPMTGMVKGQLLADAAAATVATVAALAEQPQETGPSSGRGSRVGQTSSFRNVSACNRCRLRKNRCDQNLPSCASCEKARVPCVGYDPITKREIPRSYVFYLETRVKSLETLLCANNIAFPPRSDLDVCSRPGADTGQGNLPAPANGNHQPIYPDVGAPSAQLRAHGNGVEQAMRPNKSLRPGGMSGSRFLGSANGITFSRLVSHAVQSSIGDQRSTSDKTGVRPYRPGNGAARPGTSMRDSFFGLHTRPTINPAEFPDRDTALQMITLYFEHANPQIPVLHREEFLRMFELAYANQGRVRGPRELYMLNMVFAIGGGMILDTPSRANEQEVKCRKAQPEEYHASAIIHLEGCLSSSGGGLEELQAVLLLANFALLRPVPPGLWYIVGVAVRVAVDLGLHYEDAKDVEVGLDDLQTASRERGKREYIRDLRRRLWWCTYSLDRLVSSCVGRPFGVSDQVIITEFPSMFDDRYITPDGISLPPGPEPTYKIVAHHYFRLRLLQSEILQVLQYQQTQVARAKGQNQDNMYMHSTLPSPFLLKFSSFGAWRSNIDQRLLDWKQQAPTKQDSGVAFATEFLELNYWQAILLLYRQSLSVPALFESEYNTSKEINSPSVYAAEAREDEETICLKVAEAGQKSMRLYRHLHVNGLVSYTYLATHHLFMAGLSYLYAIWHSPTVRRQLTMDEVDFTVLSAISVFTDLAEKCPAAELCRDAFNRTVKATLKMAQSTGGFGPAVARSQRPSHSGHDGGEQVNARETTANRHGQRLSVDHPMGQASLHYDMNFSEGMNRPGSRVGPMQGYQFRSPMVHVKSESEYSMIRGMPTPGHSRGNNSDPAMTPDNSAIDPLLLPSAGQSNSAVSMANMTPQSVAGTQQFPSAVANAGNMDYLRSPSTNYGPSSGSALFSDLQDIDFLQSLQNSSAPDGEAGGEVDFGFGMGWEGARQDFSDTPQVDLFDGFFFGGQLGGTNMNMGGM